jgi:hypothetical protein
MRRTTVSRSIILAAVMAITLLIGVQSSHAQDTKLALAMQAVNTYWPKCLDGNFAACLVVQQALAMVQGGNSTGGSENHSGSSGYSGLEQRNAEYYNRHQLTIPGAGRYTGAR